MALHGQVPASELSDIEKDLPDPWLLWRKLLALGLIFFCASFNLTILQNLKVCCRPLRSPRLAPPLPGCLSVCPPCCPATVPGELHLLQQPGVGTAVGPQLN